jgi:hypothetical protein
MKAAEISLRQTPFRRLSALVFGLGALAACLVTLKYLPVEIADVAELAGYRAPLTLILAVVTLTSMFAAFLASIERIAVFRLDPAVVTIRGWVGAWLASQHEETIPLDDYRMTWSRSGGAWDLTLRAGGTTMVLRQVRCPEQELIALDAVLQSHSDARAPGPAGDDGGLA